MKIQKIALLTGFQDGAIWGDLLFHLNHKGECKVYDMNMLTQRTVSNIPAEPIAEFILDQAERIVPHCNAVMFGCYRYSSEDEFPLLYSNIYNNYSKSENRLEGVCCVYRLQRQGSGFVTTLVQLISIGFTADKNLWSSEAEDVRPYGNFTIDRERELYHAFTMRDADHTTRYFTFRVPRVEAGEPDAIYGVNHVVLQPEDILSSFDCEYHHYIQGACTHSGKIYSVEGFGSRTSNLPALRIIDPQRKCQEAYFLLEDYGLEREPEMIDFWGDRCCYCDGHGHFYYLTF